MNERDSEAATAMLAHEGLIPVDNEEDADVLVFNTCSVRDQAERKAIGKIGLMKRLKKRKPDMVIGIMGCMAQNHGESLVQQLPHVDFVIGTGQLHTLPDVVKTELEKRRTIVSVEHDSAVLTGLGAHNLTKDQVSAFIAISRGCDRFCSYCIVPYVRGREKSRAIPDIVSEARLLVQEGIKEIMLLGQNVAAFGAEGKAPPLPEDFSPFADLLTELDSIDGLARIRFTSPHPAYFNEKLINTIISTNKVCDHVHLPLQSGSDKILKAMNRPYTSDQYSAIIEKLRSARPDMTFSTDIIVGFPGETDEDFEQTRLMMRQVAFDNAYIFKYSPRQGTKAAKLEDSVPQKAKEERNKILLDELANIVKKRNMSYKGKMVEVLVEGPSKRNPKRWSGRTSNNKNVVFEPNDELKRGDLVHILIDHATSMTLFGSISPK